MRGRLDRVLLGGLVTVFAATVTGFAHLGRLVSMPQAWEAAAVLPDLGVEDGLALAALGAILVPAALLGLGPRGLATLALTLVAALLGLAPRAVAPPPAPTAGNGRTVVLLSLDTLRADFVSSWPQARSPGLTPSLDALVDEGTAFHDARAPAPLTLPVHTTWFTGLAPTEHGVLRNGLSVPAEPATLAEVLARAGWLTAAFPSAAFLGHASGLTRGFHVVADGLGPHPARGLLPLSAVLLGRPAAAVASGEQTVERALRWLDTVPASVDLFLWVHLYDAHTPRRVDPQLPSPVPAGALAEPCAWADHPAATRLGTGNPFRPLAPPLPPTSDCRHDASGGVDAYGSAVRRLDRAAGHLLDGLRRRHRLDRLVVAADHGESLVEHQQFDAHMYSVYEPVAHVPLWVVGPGYAPGSSTRPVSTSAMTATLRELAGLDAGGSTFAVPSPIRVTVGPAPVAYGRRLGERVGQAAARDGALVALVDGYGHVERYDLDRDPDQRHPQVTAAEQAACRAELDAALDRPPAQDPMRWLGRLPGVDASSAAPALRQAHVCGEVSDDVSNWVEAVQAAQRAVDAFKPVQGDGAEALEALGYAD